MGLIVVLILLAAAVTTLFLAVGGNGTSDRAAPLAKGPAAQSVQALYRACRGHYDGPGQSCSTVPQPELLQLCNSLLPTGLTPVDRGDLVAPDLSAGGLPADPGLGPRTAVGGADGQEPFAIDCSHYDSPQTGWAVTVGLPSRSASIEYSENYCATPGPTTTCQDTAAGPVAHVQDDSLLGDEFELRSSSAYIAARVNDASADQSSAAAALFSNTARAFDIDAIIPSTDTGQGQAPTYAVPSYPAPISTPDTPQSQVSTSASPSGPTSTSCPTVREIESAVAASEPNATVSGGKVLGCAGGWAGVSLLEYGNSAGFVLHRTSAHEWVVVDKTTACSDPAVPRAAIEVVCASS